MFHSLFATQIAMGKLPHANQLNRKLLKDIEEFSSQDKMGKKWSKDNYQGGYTSYASLSDMHYRSPAFQQLESFLQPQVEKFAKVQGWKLKGQSLSMTACWMNVMPRGCYHTLHLHPHSVISGTYYVTVPAGSSGLKLEDPRMSFYMNAPVREARKVDLYQTLSPKAGMFVMFESWLRHEVPPNRSKQPRVSISFNYSIESE